MRSSKELSMVTISVLEEDLSFEHCVTIDQACVAQLRAGVTWVALDLAAVETVAPNGLVLLARRAVRLREYGGDLKLVRAKQSVRLAVEFGGLEWCFDFCETADEATEAVALGIRPRLLVSKEEERAREASLRMKASLSRVEVIALAGALGVETEEDEAKKLGRVNFKGAVKVHEAMLRAEA